jgi:hypothetical protein
MLLVNVSRCRDDVRPAQGEHNLKGLLLERRDHKGNYRRLSPRVQHSMWKWRK